MRNYMEEYQRWLDSPALSNAEWEELNAIRDDKKEIESRFFAPLEFGTAGLRGEMALGCRRMNIHVIRHATQAFAEVIKAEGAGACSRGIAICFDCRVNSERFAHEAASVMAANGIHVRIFDALRPTPELSFAVKHYGTTAGLNITASHNPKEYNGYKVYDAKGCQLCTADAAAALDYINAVDDYNAIPFCSDHANIHPVGDRELDAFIAAVEQQSLYTQPSDLKIVYTPLHGTGNVPVRRVLRNMHVSVVKSQELPDGNFSTGRSPNPEDKDALTLAIAQAKAEGADLVLGTDPDCDRVGIAVRDGDDYVLFTGNQTGALLVQFVLTMKKAQLNEKSTLVKTIVTSDLGANIGRSFGLQIEETLTGFKYIGDKINTYEETGDKEFVIGYEESYGYLVGTHARAKDAVVSAMLICQMAAWYKNQGKTLVGALHAVYEKYGYYLDALDSFVLKGKDGAEKIGALMQTFRAGGDQMFAGVERVQDFAKGIGDLPKENVLKFLFTDGSWLAVRPSGTEPKIKVYYSIVDPDKAAAHSRLAALQAQIKEMIGE